MKKRILSIILSIVMLVGLLPTTALAADTYTIYIAGLAMTASADGTVSYYVNDAGGAAGTVTDTEPQSGWNAKLSYDTAEQTLVLEADGLIAPSTTVNGWTGGYAAIYSAEAPLNVKLINSASTIGSTGSNDNNGYGIYSSTALTIDVEVNGSTITAPGKNTSNGSSMGIYCSKSIVINSNNPTYELIVRASHGDCGSTYGICTSSNSIIFNGGTVKANAGSGSSGNDNGITSKNITVNSGATVYGYGGTGSGVGYGIRAESFGTLQINNGATVYGYGGSNVTNSAGISINGNLVIDGGTLVAEGKMATGGSYGMRADDARSTFRINGGQITLSASSNGTETGSSSMAPILPTAAYGWKTSAGDDLTLSTTTGYTYDAAHTYLYVETLHAHPACGDDECADHGDAVTYEVWDGTSEPSGNVYLTDDVTLTDTLTISSDTVNLCLNGNSITKESGTAIKVESGATLNICDCKGSGSISATSNNADITGIDNSGNVNIYGGTVKATRSGYSGSGTGIKNTNGSVTVSGGVIDSSTTGITNVGGTLTVSGGTVHGVNTGIGTNSNITISGSPNITGGCDINLYNGSIIIGGALTYAEERAISVRMSTPGTFTSDWTNNMGENADDYDSYFTAWSSSYTVQPDGSGELKLAEPPAHNHSWTYAANGATMTATCGGAGICDATNTTLTLEAPSLRYDGAPKEASFAGNKTSIGGVNELVIKYQQATDNNDWQDLNEAPIVPGNYRAFILIDSQLAYVEYAIAKKSSSFYDNIDGDYEITDITHNSFKVTVKDVHGLRGLALEYAVEDDINGDNYTDVTLDENYSFIVTVDDELIGEYIEFALRVAAPDAYTEPGTMDTEMVQLLTAPASTTYTVTVTNGTGNGNYAEGTSVTITANAPETGKQFKEWTGVDSLTFTSGSATTATATFTMPAEAVTVTATYEDIPVTAYTVTVTNDGNGTASASLTSGTTGTEVTLTATPNTGYHFKEWQVISGGVTVSENKFTIGTANVEIKAVFEEDAPGTYTVSGTVRDHDTFLVADATVTLKRGNEVCGGPTTTNASGQYSFSNVPAGVYNIVAEKGGVTMTILITVTNANITNGDITMPNGKVNSKLEVKDEDGAETPDVVVDGLQKEAAAVKTEHQGATDVTVTMTVQAKAPDPGNAAQEKISAVAPGGATIEYLDITVKKTVVVGSNVGTSSISETCTVMEIVVPYDFTGKDSVTVYRQHGSEAAKALTKLTDKPDSPADGFFWMDETNGNIHIYAKKFSTYAIGYTTSDAGNSGGSNRPSGGGSYAHACVSKCQICGGCTDAKCTERVCAVKCKLLTMSFADVTEALWCYDAVTYVYHHGLMQGYGDNEFYPDGTVTRQQVWMILARMSGADPKSMTAARLWAMETGISDGTDPTAYVTRQQFVTMLWRYAKDMGWDVSVGEDTNILSYNDAFSVAEYAIPAMQWACGEGIIAGKTSANGMILAPKSNATRGQLATIMMRFCTKIAN